MTDTATSSGNCNSSCTDTTKKDQSLLDLINKDTTAKATEATTREGFTLQNPLFGILIPRVTAEGQPLPSSMIGLASSKDTARVNALSENESDKSYFPARSEIYVEPESI